MALSDELEKLARLHQQGALTRQEFERAKAKVLNPVHFRGVRRKSTTRLFGLPLWAIATGPDPETGEMRGHAEGIVAVGDVATGVLALGGVARGVIAFGGFAVGLVSAGGAAIGVLTALGGAALGGLAIGGASAGGVAIGGGAVGHYAIGGQALGDYVISASRCDPQAQAFFLEHFAWLPEIGNALGQPPAARGTSMCDRRMGK